VWQCLFLRDLDGYIAKAELYAPVLPAMLGIAEIREALGSPRVLVLNPASTPLAKMPDWTELKDKTRQYCGRRGDTEKSVAEREGTIAAEAPAWRTLVAEQGAIELIGWPFPEYRFKTEDNSQLLRDARHSILSVAPDLGTFFKQEDEL
jgi:hypothetical protein